MAIKPAKTSFTRAEIREILERNVRSYGQDEGFIDFFVELSLYLAAHCSDFRPRPAQAPGPDNPPSSKRLPPVSAPPPPPGGATPGPASPPSSGGPRLAKVAPYSSPSGDSPARREGITPYPDSDDPPSTPGSFTARRSITPALPDEDELDLDSARLNMEPPAFRGPTLPPPPADLRGSRGSSSTPAIKVHQVSLPGTGADESKAADAAGQSEPPAARRSSGEKRQLPREQIIAGGKVYRSARPGRRPTDIVVICPVCGTRVASTERNCPGCGNVMPR